MDDNYTDLVLEGREYELLRARRGLLTRWSIPQKIRGCSYLLFATSAMFPLMYFLPTTVRETYLGLDPMSTRVGFTVLALLSVGCLLAASLGLTTIAIYRDRLDDISEELAWSLVGVESMFSGIGFITGMLGVVATLALSGIGHAGVETIDQLVASGIDPYHAGPAFALTVVTASGLAFCCAIAVFVLGSVVESLE